MRILIVTGSFPPMRCGVGDYSYNLAKALIEEPNVFVGVLTSELCGDTGQVAGIEVFPVLKRWSFFEILKVIKVIRFWSPDIIHIQYPTQGYGNGFLPWILPMLSFFMRKKIVQTWHGGYGGRDVLKFFLKLIVPTKLVFVHNDYKSNFHTMYTRALLKKKPLYISNASAIPYINLSEYERDKIRRMYLKKQARLVVFFGFVYSHKGVELLFDIADYSLDHIVIAGEVDKNSEYFHKIMSCVSSEAWLGKVTITGFLPVADVAQLLGASDAVILPFRTGGGEWNTSIHGAVLNKAMVITISLIQSGYDKKRNVYFAKVGDIQEMKLALNTYAGIRRTYDADIDVDEWVKIAKQHYCLYEDTISK